MNRRSLAIAAVLCVGLAACSKGPKKEPAQSARPADTTAVTMTIPDVITGKGTGPVAHVDAASLDPSRAADGKQLYENRCIQCHKPGTKFIGPPLEFVTRRRPPEWILNMILSPEVMTYKDAKARELLGQYVAPMVNRHVTRDQAESIFVFLRERDNAAVAAVQGAGADTTTATANH